MTGHLGYEKHDPVGNDSGNSRNGATAKIIGKGQRRFTGFDEKSVSMYTWGMSMREIQGHLKEIYQVAVYPIIYLDALVVKIRETDPPLRYAQSTSDEDLAWPFIQKT